MKVFGQLLFLYSLSFFCVQGVWAQISISSKLSDKDDDKKIFKFYSENESVKFLKKGDMIHFRAAESKEKDLCTVSLIQIEDHYLTGQIGKEECVLKHALLRGTNLVLDIPLWGERMEEAKAQKQNLMNQKTKYLFQLNELNNFIYNYSDEKKKLETLYEQKINELMKEKNQALKDFAKRKDNSFLEQAKLQKELDQLDFQIMHF